MENNMRMILCVCVCVSFEHFVVTHLFLAWEPPHQTYERTQVWLWLQKLFWLTMQDKWCQQPTMQDGTTGTNLWCVPTWNLQQLKWEKPCWWPTIYDELGRTPWNPSVWRAYSMLLSTLSCKGLISPQDWITSMPSLFIPPYAWLPSSLIVFWHVCYIYMPSYWVDLAPCP